MKVQRPNCACGSIYLFHFDFKMLAGYLKTISPVISLLFVVIVFAKLLVLWKLQLLNREKVWHFQHIFQMTFFLESIDRPESDQDCTKKYIERLFSHWLFKWGYHYHRCLLCSHRECFCLAIFEQTNLPPMIHTISTLWISAVNRDVFLKNL